MNSGSSTFFTSNPAEEPRFRLRRRLMIDLERFHDGDHKYFSDLIREYGRVAKAVCLSFGDSEDDVDDLLQEVWKLVYEKRRSYRGNGTLGGWLFRLATHHCIDTYRKGVSERKGMEKVVARGGINELHSSSRDPERDLDRKEAEKVLWRALDALPRKERQSIVLRLLECRSPLEVATEMGIGKGSVRSNISRGIKRLRGIMGGGQ